ncbi:ATP-binding cassette domain-containing protein [Cytobacillus oceanisediminis]|uniref:ABC transporter ATP-binding protein n=1 Tax=Cytobacillus oceanisediminis TaxID=665099 RepID=UPI00203BBE42|nr:ATP-binding cassette domain-containing protein [Cytobacillus oceanisediminis]MCM3244937.1 ATP-binding cassette domain-containing protein [Cytobacillus oceanisediminis]
MRPKIAFYDVSKSFNLYRKQSDKLLEVISFKKNKDNFFALKNISFEIYEGEAIGVVGLNGSGKSTLSNLLAQIIPPSSGSIDLNGETSLIAISAGLNNQLTGLENVELKCLMHGLRKEEITKITSDIIEFADIGKFIDQPVKNYSSGMKSRLGFAISIHTNPDILIIDEALSVGDQTFYEKCLVKINEFKSQGKTIIFISHSLSQIESLCDRVMWVHFGRIEIFAQTNKVINQYKDFINWFNKLNDQEKKNYRKEMLDDQYKEIKQKNKSITSTRKLNKKKSGKIGNVFIPIQFIILFLGVVLSALLMFEIQPVQGIGSYINSYIDNKEQSLVKETHKEGKPEFISKEINKEGIVSVGQAEIYNDSDLKNKTTDISFANNVFIEEQLNAEIYKIKSNGVSGFTKMINIKLMDDDLPNVQIGITDFIPLFPERFSNAFEYFFTFLNTDSEEVKSKVRGLSSEERLNNGERILTYSVYDARYITDLEGITKSITVSNIDTSRDEWDRIKHNASLISNDSQCYLFKTDEFNIVVDQNNNTTTFTLVE